MPGNNRATAMTKVQSMVFNKSLSSMVKGIRAAKDKGQSEYIAKCIHECKDELASPYMDDKANALRKLIYLQMIGYDMSWASFRIIEVMSAQWFGHRRVGYLAATLSFTQSTDVVLLTTHLFRKAFTLTSNGQDGMTEGLMFESGCALACLAQIVTPDLSKDILNDIYLMMNNSNPYVRKKSVLVLYRICKRWPQALRLSFARLKDRLEDENQSVVSAAVYVICELAERNAKNYLPLAPTFFKILTTSTNNWVLIKVVKLLGALSPEEPRLAKKLAEPLADIITTTPAKSLLYECVNTLLKGKLTSKAAIRLCMDKLKSFIEDPDQNLKYLGLLGLHKLMQKHPSVVVEHKDMILNCLSDEDVTIRMRALDLITAMVSKKNLNGIITRLVSHLDTSDGSYKDTVLERIIFICSQNNYDYVSDFGWYVQILVDLTKVSGINIPNARRISEQLMDVIIRVPAVRPFGVGLMVQLVLDGRLVSTTGSSSGIAEVLSAAAWLCGEFSQLVKNKVAIITSLLKPLMASLSPPVQCILMQNVLKLFTSILASPWSLDAADPESSSSSSDDEEEDGKSPVPKLMSYRSWQANVKAALDLLLGSLPLFSQSSFVEVQERAVAYLSFLKWIGSDQGPGLFLHQVPPPKEADPLVAPDATPGSTPPQPSQPVEVDLLALEAPPPPVSSQPSLAAMFDPMAVNTSAPVPSPTPASSAPALQSGADAAAPLADAKQDGEGFAHLSAAELQQRVARVSDLVLQCRALFFESLKPVHPSAQRKVPIPAGLDLDVWINPQEEATKAEDSEKEKSSDDEVSSEEDPDEDPKARKKRLKAKAKAKAEAREEKRKELEVEKKKKKEKKESEAGYGDEGFEVKKASKDEIAAAKARQEALKAQRANDPFYIGDMGASKTTQAEVDDIPMKKLDDEDLPPLEVAGGEEETGKKKKKIKGLKPPKIEYKVAGVLELPEGAQEEKVEQTTAKKQPDDFVDLSSPLGADEVIAAPQTYTDILKAKEKEMKKNKTAGKEDTKDKEEEGKKKKDKKKKDKKHKKDKKGRDDGVEEVTEVPHEEGDGAEGDGDEGEQKEEKSAPNSPAPQRSIMDMFDPMAAQVAQEQKQKGPAFPVSPSDVNEREMTVVYEDKDVCLSAAITALQARSFAACSVRFQAKYLSKKAATLVVQVSNGDGFAVSAVSEGKISANKGGVISFGELEKGALAEATCQLEWSVPFSAAEVRAKLSLARSDKTKSEKFSLPVQFAHMLAPIAISMDQLATVVVPCVVRKAITIRDGLTIGEALKQVASGLHVKLVQAVFCAATYFGGMVFDSSPVAVLIKSKKGDEKHLGVEVKASIEAHAAGVLANIEVLLCQPVEATPEETEVQ